MFSTPHKLFLVLIITFVSINSIKSAPVEDDSSYSNFTSDPLVNILPYPIIDFPTATTAIIAVHNLAQHEATHTSPLSPTPPTTPEDATDFDFAINNN